ncbi:MAG: long-chain acyl-CoA synthetase [Arcticibacterium sp.]|jgi:long-chain acyl-CoA synthetase
MSEIEKGVLWYFYHWEKKKAQEVFLRQPFGTGYIDFTWEEVGNEVRKLAAFLKSLNLPANSNIGLFSKNCAEWIIADLGIIMAGHVVVPFYPSLNSNQLSELINHSGCKVLFYGKLDHIPELQKSVSKDLVKVSFPRYNPIKTHLQWDALMNQHKPITESPLWDKDSIYTIIYTSGTTGKPKGVMVSHKIPAQVFPKVHKTLKWDIPNLRFFSYLPLAHAGERSAVEAACLRVGGVIYFAESLETFSQNLIAASPTHFLGVPRIWSHFRAGILTKIPQNRLDFLLKIPLVKDLIKKKIKKGLGLQNTIIMQVGASSVPIDLLKWFRKIDIELTNVYGMTENLGVATIMPALHKKDHSVGKAWDGVEIKIIPGTSEICTRAPWNMEGYYNEPEMTAEAIDSEGWLHTGDLGALDNDGFLTIKGRLKEIFKTSKGEFIVPSSLEMHFSEIECIEHICILGEHLPRPIGLLTLSETPGTINKEEIEAILAFHLQEINEKLRPYERIKKLVILPEQWTVENDRVTPTLKLKRHSIEHTHAAASQLWYDLVESIIWAN